MQTMLRSVTLCAVGGFLTACGRSPAFTAADADSLRAGTGRYVETALAANWEGWAGLFTDDVVFLPPNDTARAGRDAVQAWGEAFPHLTAFAAPITEIMGYGDLAVVRGSFALTVMTADSASVDDRGKYLGVWRRQTDGTWKLSRNIWNSDMPVSPVPQ